MFHGNKFRDGCEKFTNKFNMQKSTCENTWEKP